MTLFFKRRQTYGTRFAWKKLVQFSLLVKETNSKCTYSHQNHKTEQPKNTRPQTAKKTTKPQNNQQTNKFTKRSIIDKGDIAPRSWKTLCPACMEQGHPQVEQKGPAERCQGLGGLRAEWWPDEGNPERSGQRVHRGAYCCRWCACISHFNEALCGQAEEQDQTRTTPHFWT